MVATKYGGEKREKIANWRDKWNKVKKGTQTSPDNSILKLHFHTDNTHTGRHDVTVTGNVTMATSGGQISIY